MNSQIKNCFIFLVLCLCACFFFYFLSTKLTIGGRWCSGQALGGVDSFLYSNGDLYPSLEKGINAGTSYFPGIVFVSYLYSLIFGYGAETAFIVTAGVIGLLFFLCCAIISSDNKNKRLILFIIATAIFAKEFPAAKAYLLEMHPDIPSLTCFFGGLIFIVLTRYWSVIHPFAFQIVVIGGLIIVANIASSPDIRIKFLVIASTCLILLYGINQHYKTGKADHETSKNTSSLIKLVDDNFKEVSFNFDNTYSCGAFNPGMLWFVSSYPNYTFNEKLGIGSKKEKVECIDPQKSILKFYDYSNEKSYYVTYN